MSSYDKPNRLGVTEYVVAEELRISVPYGVLLTRTNPAIRTRTMTHIQRGLTEAGVVMFQAELNEREAFRAMFSFRQPLEALNPAEVGKLDKAIANAEAFAREVVSMVRRKAAATAAKAGVREPARYEPSQPLRGHVRLRSGSETEAGRTSRNRSDRTRLRLYQPPGGNTLTRRACEATAAPVHDGVQSTTEPKGHS